MNSRIFGLRSQRRRAAVCVASACLWLPAVLVLSGCGARSSKAPAAVPAMTITVGTPSSRRIPIDIVASGSVAAWEEMSLGVELAGVRVDKVLVEVGAKVKAGQPLLQLDARTLSVQARQAEAGVAQARASLQLARSSAVRGESLLAQKLISASNYDSLQADLRRAEAQIASAQADYDAARLRLGFTTLRAPDDGIISSRTVQPGQIVAVGTELLRLIRRGRLEWRAQVAENDLIRVRPGAPVELKSPDGTRVEGVVRAISPAIDPQTRMALIYADLPHPDGLRAGMFAAGRLQLGETDAMVLPRDSVVMRDGYAYVFVLGPGSKVAQRRVDIGSAQGDSVVIRSGLKPGEQIAIRGAGFLSDGDQVRVVAGS